VVVVAAPTRCIPAARCRHDTIGDRADRMQDAIYRNERDVRGGARRASCAEFKTRGEALQRTPVAEVAGETDAALYASSSRLRRRPDGDDDVALRLIGSHDETARYREFTREQPARRTRAVRGNAVRIERFPPGRNQPFLPLAASLRSFASAQARRVSRGLGSVYVIGVV